MPENKKSGSNIITQYMLKIRLESCNITEQHCLGSTAGANNPYKETTTGSPDLNNYAAFSL